MLLAASMLLLLTGCKGKGQESFADLPDVGKKSLGKWSIPAEVVTAIAARNNKAQPGVVQSSAEKAPSWTSPEVTLSEKDGPFMAVLVMDGKAQAAGTRAKYTVAWDGLESTKPGFQHATISHFLNFGHYGESRETYPTKVRKAVASTPFRTEKPQKVRLVIELEELKGLVPEQMTLELRSGVGSSSGLSLIMNLQWLLLGFVMMFVWWWLFRRER